MRALSFTCEIAAPQAKTLRKGVNVLVATPGRLEDLMNDNAARLHHITCACPRFPASTYVPCWTCAGLHSFLLAR